MKAASTGRDPDLLHRGLRIDDDFRAVVEKFDLQYVAAAAAFNINIGRFALLLQTRLDLVQHGFGQRQKFGFAHATLQTLFIAPRIRCTKRF